MTHYHPNLFGEELKEYWQDHWWGMPEFSHQDLRPVKQVIVSFATYEEIAEFEKVIGQRVLPTTQSVWFAPQPIGEYKDKSYEPE